MKHFSFTRDFSCTSCIITVIYLLSQHVIMSGELNPHDECALSPFCWLPNESFVIHWLSFCRIIALSFVMVLTFFLFEKERQPRSSDLRRS